MNELIQPIDLAYFKTAYFWVTTGITVVLLVIWSVRWYQWEERDEVDGYTTRSGY